MIRYFFHVRRDLILIEDCEGGEFENIEAASREAVEAAKELLITAIRTGKLIDYDTVEIWTEENLRVGEVRLSDLIPIRRPVLGAG